MKKCIEFFFCWQGNLNIAHTKTIKHNNHAPRTKIYNSYGGRKKVKTL